MKDKLIEEAFGMAHYRDDAATKVDCMYKFGEGIVNA